MKLKVQKLKLSSGFTLLELMLVMGMIVILATVTLPLSLDFLFRHTLIEESKILESNLKSAQTKAISAEKDSSFGVKFLPADVCPEEDCYVVFQGSSYSTREQGEDEVFYLSAETIVELVGEYSEIVFEKNTGFPNFR